MRVGTVDDPLVHPHRLMRRWRMGALLAVPMLVWAVWPYRTPELPVVEPTAVQTAANSAAQRPPLRLAAFDAAIWTLDPPPPTPTAPPPPLRLQLVGLLREGGTTKAVIYDPDTDELTVVAEGAKIGARTVTRVDATGVTLAEVGGGAGVRRLLMETRGTP
ncbi:MAG TPA: hypothetical protein VFF65_09475 [Phycisphaerales bacterium]|nr:hypothetical protein [Phycisphaerales bacterium]